ncbi:D-alanyl-D-alanine carboxypeptidase family protein [Paenibacillus castaneae]|uniref:D-alanyl-D-alanine carboxypeptidase family protein n=2 Tax=Paenibacillus castaneae TaxID=474957 RepID=UPI001FCFE531|nr:D-alanyl-D-alanine carboxypeptidase family protein [Paenibacillus castaneae]
MMESRRGAHKSNHSFIFMLIAAAVIICMPYLVSMKDSPKESELALGASAAVLMDLDTGKVLYEKNAYEALPPASMSKMMTELIVLDLANEGKLAWNELVLTSHYAAEVPGSQIGFDAGERYTVRELFEAMAVHSANDAAVALAEHISGNETAFVMLMNARAARIGLSESAQFGNATGLTHEDLLAFPEASAQRDTMISAKDTAVLAGHLLKKYPEILEVSKQSSVKLASTMKKLPSTNLMLSGMTFAYPGNDGLKTGYTVQAGYCFTGTAKQEGRRLVSVVMGASTPEQRFEETGKLFQYGFQESRLESWIGRIQSKLGIQVS